MDNNLNKESSGNTEIDGATSSTKKLPPPNSDFNLSKEELIARYKQFLLIEEKSAASVFQFSKFLNIEESQFYELFSSINSLEHEIWKGYFQDTLERIQGEEVYINYTVREKLLAFFYTLLEVLKKDRSFIINVMKGGLLPRWTPSFLDEFKVHYLSFINELINEGKETGEVADRFLISSQYGQGLWLQFMFILNFWVRDESHGFEKTDAAVEKAVNFSLDLMGRTALDSFTDFAKFVFQSWR